MNGFILPLMFSGLGRSEQAAFLERIVPALLPAGNQQLTVTALMAQQQVKQQSRVDERLVAEAVTAARFTKAEDLDAFPTLQQKFASLSAAAKAKIFPPPPPPTARSFSLVSAITMAPLGSAAIAPTIPESDSDSGRDAVALELPRSMPSAIGSSNGGSWTISKRSKR